MSPFLCWVRWSHHAVIKPIICITDFFAKLVIFASFLMHYWKDLPKIFVLMGWVFLISILNLFRLFTSIFSAKSCSWSFREFFFASLVFIPLTHLFMWQSITYSQNPRFYDSFLHFLHIHLSAIYPVVFACIYSRLF